MRPAELPLAGGFDAGPLFAHGNVRRPPKRPPGRSMDGRIRRAAERRATPAWADRAATRALFREAKARTQETGVVHAVDHVVPLNHPLVCGLHWHGNMEVITHLQNQAKSNSYWPGMWGEQAALL